MAETGIPDGERERRGSRLEDLRVETRGPSGERGAPRGPWTPPRGEGLGRGPCRPHGPSRAGGLAAPVAPRPALEPPAPPVLAGCDHAVFLGDEQRGRDGVLVPLDLAQQHRAAALRPGVDLGRHVRAAAAASRAGGPSADGGAGGDAPVSPGLPGPRGSCAAVNSRVLPPPVLPGEAAQLNLRGREKATEKGGKL